jgi:hypothetical protein
MQVYDLFKFRPELLPVVEEGMSKGGPPARSAAAAACLVSMSAPASVYVPASSHAAAHGTAVRGLDASLGPSCFDQFYIDTS